MDKKLPNIFDYIDFKKYFSDYITACKHNGLNNSGGKICRELGIPNSRSYVNSVIHGRKITRTFVTRFIKVLNFNKAEAIYFRLLVNYGQAEEDVEKELYAEILSLYKLPKEQAAKKALALLGM